MSLTPADIQRMRESRKARIATTKSDMAGDAREMLLVENIAAGSKIWWPSDPFEGRMRILDFMVSDANNIRGDKVGDFATYLTYQTHTVNKKTTMCPGNWGKACPLCAAYSKHYDDVKANRQHFAAKFRPKVSVAFNVLLEVAGEDGKKRILPRVLRAGRFFSQTKIGEALTAAEKFAKGNIEQIYAFSDLEIGYWFEVQLCDAPAVQGNKDEFMQITSCKPEWKKPVDHTGAYQYVTDLDTLLPPCPTDEEISALSGIVSVGGNAEESEVETIEEHAEDGIVIDEGIDLGGTIGDEIPGAVEVPVAPAVPTPPPAVAPLDIEEPEAPVEPAPALPPKPAAPVAGGTAPALPPKPAAPAVPTPPPADTESDGESAFGDDDFEGIADFE